VKPGLMKKQHILDEIKRTATENGGRALGRLRFETATGIREHDWRGVFWARWNDAVAEAGLAPNALVAAHDEDHLLQKVAGLALEQGRFPVSSEMRLKRRTDPTFPNDKAIFDRFGGKAELARKVMEYSAARPELAAVVALCVPLIPTDAAEETDNEEFETGYVYLALMKVGREKRYKIGKANLVEQRARQVAVNLPEDIELIHAISTDDAYGIEAYWHKRFAEKRRGGEWFDLAADDVRAFKRRRFM
jgi:Meiotically up-regulated gene 113